MMMMKLLQRRWQGQQILIPRLAYYGVGNTWISATPIATSAVSRIFANKAFAKASGIFNNVSGIIAGKVAWGKGGRE